MQQKPHSHQNNLQYGRPQQTFPQQMLPQQMGQQHRTQQMGQQHRTQQPGLQQRSAQYNVAQQQNTERYRLHQLQQYGAQQQGNLKPSIARGNPAQLLNPQHNRVQHHNSQHHNNQHHNIHRNSIPQNVIHTNGTRPHTTPHTSFKQQHSGVQQTVSPQNLLQPVGTQQHSAQQGRVYQNGAQQHVSAHVRGHQGGVRRTLSPQDLLQLKAIQHRDMVYNRAPQNLAPQQRMVQHNAAQQNFLPRSLEEIVAQQNITLQSLAAQRTVLQQGGVYPTVSPQHFSQQRPSQQWDNRHNTPSAQAVYPQQNIVYPKTSTSNMAHPHTSPNRSAVPHYTPAQYNGQQTGSSSLPSQYFPAGATRGTQGRSSAHPIPSQMLHYSQTPRVQTNGRMQSSSPEVIDLTSPIKERHTPSPPRRKDSKTQSKPKSTSNEEQQDTDNVYAETSARVFENIQKFRKQQQLEQETGTKRKISNVDAAEVGGQAKRVHTQNVNRGYPQGLPSVGTTGQDVNLQGTQFRQAAVQQPVQVQQVGPVQQAQIQAAGLAATSSASTSAQHTATAGTVQPLGVNTAARNKDLSKAAQDAAPNSKKRSIAETGEQENAGPTKKPRKQAPKKTKASRDMGGVPSPSPEPAPAVPMAPVPPVQEDPIERLHRRVREALEDSKYAARLRGEEKGWRDLIPDEPQYHFGKDVRTCWGCKKLMMIPIPDMGVIQKIHDRWSGNGGY